MIASAILAATALRQLALPPLPEYSEMTAENYSARLAEGHTLSIFAVCRFVNRKLEVWGPDGTVWDDKTKDEEMKEVRRRMESELFRISTDTRKPSPVELSLYVLTTERGGFTAKETLATDRFQPQGGGTGKIVAALRSPKPTPGRAFADISILATPDEVGTRIFSFRADLSDLPVGIKIKEINIQKGLEAWFYHLLISGLPKEVTTRWFGIRSEEGNMFERKFPSIGRIAWTAHPDEFSVTAPTQPKENPDRTLHLYACRTWKITFPEIYLRPKGWRGD